MRPLGPSPRGWGCPIGPPGLRVFTVPAQQHQHQQQQQQQQHSWSHEREAGRLRLHAQGLPRWQAALRTRPFEGRKGGGLSTLLLQEKGRLHVWQQQQQQQQQRRCISSFQRAMRRLQWPLMRADMTAFFDQQLRGPAQSLEELHRGAPHHHLHHHQQQQQRNSLWRSSTVEVECRPWERFVSSEQLRGAGFVPCVISGKGVYRKVAAPAAALQELAFDEAEGHLSFLFKARLFCLRVGPLVELCIVREVKADPLSRRLYFVAFERHLAGSLTEVSIPLTLVGLLACPAYHQGDPRAARSSVAATDFCFFLRFP
ncbi:hypothetical protein Efla_003831 [Eimeria flavescens]